MAPHQARSNTRKVRRQLSLQKDQGKQPQGIKKERPQLSSRKSARLSRTFPQAEDRKRKRSQDDETPLSTTTPSQKRPRASLARSPIEDIICENAAVGDSREEINPLEY
ncbi:hypothetical protein DL95DRAFT_470351 [Leptodontidium sp. 2 PMI_412]|nr:hypothetical protein DL95DRAFT_470351 [Leptodontidium sp. 2 PMI_412]